MCSANASSRSVASRLARTLFLATLALQLFSGALILGVTIHHHTKDYHQILQRLSHDLVSEYAACQGDPATMRAHFAEDLEEHGAENVFILITDAAGKTRVQAAAHAQDPILAQMRAQAATPRPTTYRLSRERQDGVGRHVAVRVRKSALADGATLSVGWNVAADERHTMRVALVLALALVASLLLTGLLSVLFARRFTTPLRTLADAARRIGAGDYTARVAPSHAGREITDLETAFNAMGEQNEKTLNELRVLTDDIAHDLRTPLTRLHMAAEAAATGAHTRRPLPETVLTETENLIEMINTMLAISQTGRGIDPSPRTDIDLAAFVRDLADLYQALAEDNGLVLKVDVPARPVLLSAHKGKLQQLLGNLLDNAVKFTPRGGTIAISLTNAPFTLSVSNTGPGIAAEDVPHVFQRFWRADSSRSLPGNGLGLALAKAIATSYALSLSCQSENGLTTFTLAAPPDAPRAPGAEHSPSEARPDML